MSSSMHEISQTWVPLMTIYRNAFLTDDLPGAAALSVVLALLVTVPALLMWAAVTRLRVPAPEVARAG